MSGEKTQKRNVDSCWVEVPSKSKQGKSYYYNKVTKQSTWKLPRGVTAVKPQTETTGVNLQDEATPVNVEGKKERPPALELEGVNTGEDMEMDCDERWGDNEEVEMDVDISPELMEDLLVQISSARQGLAFSTSVDIFNVSSHSLPSLYAEKLYLVLDTNVLISHLQFLVELKDTAIRGVGRPVLVIPWVVMQELDSLKTRPNPQLSERARAAISFLHACFNSRHRRVRGQTIEEVHSEVSNMSITNNDDRILHCCLLYDAKVKGHGGVVVLFTNDINLSAKALVNNITALNRKTLLTELRMLCKTTEASSYTHTHEFATRVEQQLVQSYKEAICDDLLCEAHHLVRDGLAAIAKTEFIDAYDNLWIKLIIVKPPWSLTDLIVIFEKHWIAVFGMYVNRSLNKNVTNIKHHLQQTQGRRATFPDIEMFLENSLSLLNAYAYRSDYGGLLPVVLAKLTVLRDKAGEAKTGRLVGSSIQQPATPQLPPTPPSGSLDEVKQLATIVPPCADDQLPWALNLITETVKYFFFQVQSQAITDKQQAVDILQQLLHLLTMLHQSITSLLSDLQPPSDIVALRGVVSAIDEFLKNCLNTSTPINIDTVFRMFNNKSQVDIFRQAQQEYLSYIQDIEHWLHIITTM